MIFIETSAMKAHKISKTSDGKCLMNGFLILKWKYCAATINNPIRIAGIATKAGNQIPATKSVARETFAAPTNVRVRSLSPNCLNSLIITSYLKIQT